jgi:hypothetical protein
MPSCPNSTPPGPPPPSPWTVARAQTVLADLACELHQIAKRLGDVRDWLPRQAGPADRYDVATGVLATIECVLEDNLWPAVESLQRSAELSGEEAARPDRGGAAVLLARECGRAVAHCCLAFMELQAGQAGGWPHD